MVQPAHGNSREMSHQQTQYRIVRILNKIVSSLKVIVAVGGLVAVIMFEIPWFSGFFKKIDPADPNATILTLLTFVVVAIFFELRTLVDYSDGGLVRRHFEDPMDVYPVMLERIQSITRQNEKVIDVLGMTLYTAWPSIQFWLGRSELAGFTIRLAAVAFDDARLSPQVPAFWFRDARNNLDSALEYGRSASASKRRIKIETYGYDFSPSLHGYRLGNGDLFYSLLLWQPDGNLGYEGFSYEFVPHEDVSPSAEAIRGVFDSWFQRASRQEWTGSAALSQQQGSV